MYEPKNFDNLLGISGLSEALLQNHFSLYQGYVANTNKILELLAGLQIDDKLASPEYAELKRRLGWEFDGMRLHELYFENMMKEQSNPDPNSQLYKKITEDYGSFENFRRSFMATGAMRGIGWVILYFDHIKNKLINTWIDEHDKGHLAGCVPIMVMDVFEHAYMLDYQTKKADYIKLFMNIACWHVANERFEKARTK